VRAAAPACNIVSAAGAPHQAAGAGSGIPPPQWTGPLPRASNVEERRRLKIIPNAFGERAVLKLMFGALIRAAKRWRSIKVTEFEHRQIAAVRKDLDQEYEAQVGLKTQLSNDAAPVKISSNLRT
jgi:hypothetical protein